MVRKRDKEAVGGAGLSGHSSPARLRSPLSAGRRGGVEGDEAMREELGDGSYPLGRERERRQRAAQELDELDELPARSEGAR